MARILVVDDDPTLQDLIRMILLQAGHGVTSAFTGLETLEKLGIQPEDPAAALPEIILLDIMLPKMDGYGVGSIIRNNPRTKHIPVLVVTALREVSRLFTATVDINGIIPKPFAPEQLLEQIAAVLKDPKAYKPNPYLEDLLKS